MATAKPTPVLNQCIRYAIDKDAAPPPVTTFRGSYNFRLLSHLTGALRDVAGDADALEAMLRSQLDGRAGLYADEFGGGYAPIQTAVSLVLIRLDRDGRLDDDDLGTVARRWYGAALRMAALCAVPHRDSALVIGPAARLRSPTADELSLPLQLTVGAPAMRFGIGRGSKPDAVAWEWKSADDQAAELRRLMGVPPAQLCVECGVPPSALDMVVNRASSPQHGSVFLAGLRSLHPLRIRRYRSGDLAAWWPSFTSGDAPHAGATSIGGEIHTLQPQPIGPRAGTDTQHWGGNEVQRCEVRGGELVATFRTSKGLTKPSGTVIEQERRVPLPVGDIVLDLLIDLDGAREVRGEQPAPPATAPAPKPPPSPPLPGTPQPEPPRGGDDEPVATRGQGRALLEGFQTMRGRRPGRVTADDHERAIRRVFGL